MSAPLQRAACALVALAALAVGAASPASARASEPTPAPTPSPAATAPTAEPAAVKTPVPSAWRPPPVPTRRGKPPEREVRLGGEAPPPSSSPRPLGALATIKKAPGAPVAITDDTVGMVLPPVVPATTEEYATMILAVLQDWSDHEVEARRLIAQARGQHSLTEAESWVQGLADTASALAADSARLAAIVPPDDYRGIHSEMVSTLRTFDRAVAALAKDPSSQISLEAAQELVFDAQRRALAFAERMRTLAAVVHGGG